ncbi:Aspartate aminotransferase, cytoplasmic [Lobosporangium transversale]|uniref:aspartate transaminase n=1 Tax=Lobosporangium transversale TaxID=64571 RepID=A0A1Y2GJ25_9FUNG|nr:aspartate aminotransferase [Lobosporangium transversale]KAF9915545.1 Aspartate aminotransferase, cytoplasmic [Lobosporangium transversale]ORZ12448.1 aspartate aminotransferase [Lobosporangium transversale]|eukprot:XP_021880067.1 aspartate aminotransferase [Lobosporangium transversale]
MTSSLNPPALRLQQISNHISNNANTSSVFQNVNAAPADVIFALTSSYKADTYPKKVNLGVGAYRTEEGKPWVLPVVKKAEHILVNDDNLDHEYLPILGSESFRKASAKLILGANSKAIMEGRVGSAQCISGTGAVYTGASFLSKHYPIKDAACYISKPTWANHRAIFEGVGIPVLEYPYWDPVTKGLDLKGMLNTMQTAPNGSIFLIHPCAHNPTGVDPTPEQWKQIADVMEAKGHFTFFDCAYQGFASGNLDKDAYSVRYFVERGFELFVAQSYSKNFGLYSERAGNLVIVSKTPEIKTKIESQIAKAQRAVISNPPAFGSRIVSTVLSDEKLYAEWEKNLATMANRIIDMRKALYDELVRLGTPGKWNHIVDQIGMFSFTGLTTPQVKVLKEKYHVYLTDNGRISMAGLNSSNVKYFAQAVDDVVRNH